MIRGRDGVTRSAWHGRPGLRAAARAAGAVTTGLIVLLAGTGGLQNAVANGDTRSLDLVHEHTKESATIVYRQNGRYVTEGLRQLNWFLRDWRIEEQTEMDPKLFDIVWQVYRESRATGPIHVNSAYRSPQTNAALRRRSRAVAEYSQHMRGKAMDFYLENVSMSRVREIGMRLQSGGVGFYPHSRNQFVHLDAGGVRSWPRMPDAQLARLFPDGRTVHIPKSGQPMAGYEEAKATILARGGMVAGYSTYAEGGPKKGFWATLFGGGEDEDEDLAAPASRTRVASNESGGFFSFFRSEPARAPAPMPEPEPAPVAEVARSPSTTIAPTPIALARAPAAPAPVPVSAPLPPRRPTDIVAMVTRDLAASRKIAALAPPKAASAPERRADLRATIRPTAGSGKDKAARALAASAKPAPGRAKTSFSAAKLDPPITGALRKAPPARHPTKR
jgi:uncharacterized protein YcbK (DUF882 family)